MVLVLKPRASIELFLRSMKTFVAKHGIIIAHRNELHAYMAKHGIDAVELVGIVLALRPQDCFDGPEADRDTEHHTDWTVAEFCPLWLGRRLYLKLSIRTSDERCTCLSLKDFKQNLEVL